MQYVECPRDMCTYATVYNILMSSVAQSATVIISSIAENSLPFECYYSLWIITVTDITSQTVTVSNVWNGHVYHTIW